MVKMLTGRVLYFFDGIAERDPFTNVYGLGRSLLALSTLLTLLFNAREVLFADHQFGKYAFHTALNKINLFFLFGLDYYWMANAVAIGILLVVIAGVLPRYTGILHWWVSYSFFSAASIIEGGDQIISILTFLLIPVTLLDGRRSHWARGSLKQHPCLNYAAWGFLFLIRPQVAVLYLQSGIEKVYKVPEWANGTAVYYWFTNSIFGLPSWVLDGMIGTLLQHTGVVQVLTWGSITWEVFLFSVLFMPYASKKYLLVPALGFHFGILLVHGLISFFFAMAGALVFYLLPLDKGFSIGKTYAGKRIRFHYKRVMGKRTILVKEHSLQ